MQPARFISPFPPYAHKQKPHTNTKKTGADAPALSENTAGLKAEE